MFDEDIGKDFGLRTELLSVPESIVRVAFNEALIGKHCAGVDVDTNEGSVAGCTECEGGAGIIAQNVKADGQFDCGTNGAAGASHRSDRFGSDACFRERNIAEVFDEEGMDTAPSVGMCVGDGSGDYFFQVALPARRAREGAQVN